MAIEAEWRQCKRFQQYEINDEGVVRHRTTKHAGKSYLSAPGYRFRSLYSLVTKKQITVRLAPLVAKAWLGDRPKGKQIHHIDGNKSNDRVSNLEYVTQSRNILESYLNGHQRSVKRRILSPDDHQKIKDLWATGLSQVVIGRMFNVTNGAVSRIVRGLSSPRKILTPEEKRLRNNALRRRHYKKHKWEILRRNKRRYYAKVAAREAEAAAKSKTKE